MSRWWTAQLDRLGWVLVRLGVVLLVRAGIRSVSVNGEAPAGPTPWRGEQAEMHALLSWAQASIDPDNDGPLNDEISARLLACQNPLCRQQGVHAVALEIQ